MKDVQKFLKLAVSYEGEINGVFDTATRDAWQKLCAQTHGMESFKNSPFPAMSMVPHEVLVAALNSGGGPQVKESTATQPSMPPPAQASAKQPPLKAERSAREVERALAPKNEPRVIVKS